LGLSHVGLGAAATDELIGSPHLTGLRELNLAENELGKPAVQRLADAPFDRMAGLSVSGTMRGDNAPVFAHAWRPNPRGYERRLDLTGQAVAQPVRTKRPKATPAPSAASVPEADDTARALDPRSSYTVGERVRHPDHGTGVVTRSHAIYIDVKFARQATLRYPLLPDGALDYTAKRRFAAAEVILHATFGAGLVTKVTGDRIEVMFPAGAKTLVHAKA
ncbi:MAG: hypothetical protein H7138_19415, partial [Myxococcales bacterium]|nr:hypothetical protein [Myxococcales bacterium]